VPCLPRLKRTLTWVSGGAAVAEVVLLDGVVLVVAGHQLRHLVESLERVPVEEVLLCRPGGLDAGGEVDHVPLGHLEQVAGTEQKKRN